MASAKVGRRRGFGGHYKGGVILALTNPAVQYSWTFTGKYRRDRVLLATAGLDPTCHLRPWAPNVEISPAQILPGSS